MTSEEAIRKREYTLVVLSSSDEENPQNSVNSTSKSVRGEGEMPHVDLMSESLEGSAGKEEDTIDDWLDTVLCVPLEISPVHALGSINCAGDSVEKVDELSGSVGSMCIEDACPSIAEACHERNPNSEAQKTQREMMSILEEIVQLKVLPQANRALKERIIRTRLTHAFEKVKLLPDAVHVVLQEEVREYHRIIRATGDVWVHLKRMLEIFSPEVAERVAMEPIEARREARRLYVNHQASKIETKLKKAAKKLKKLEQMEVDLADDTHSAFIQMGAIQTKCEEWISIINQLYEESCLAPSTTMTPISLSTQNDGTGIEAVDVAVEKFINSKLHKGSPDFADLYGIIREKMQDHNKLKEDPTFLLNLATQVFRKVDQIFRRQRLADFKEKLQHHAGDVQLDLDEEEEPDEQDETLKAKLDQNLKMRKSEVDVIDYFVALEKIENEKKEISTKKRKRILESSTQALAKTYEDRNEIPNVACENKKMKNL